jgi:Ran GTPase-activating protein (RanGAP) involved in mRNA processing and transport
LELGGLNLTLHSAELFANAVKSSTTLTALNAQRFLDQYNSKLLSEAFAVNRSIKSLTLSFNALDVYECVAFGQALEVNQSITELNLAFVNLGPNGCERISQALKKNTTIQKLDLTGNNLGEGSLALADALKGNKTLTSLDLSRCNIQARECQILCTALEINQGLKSINLRYNIIGVGCWLSISNMLKVNNTLQVLNLKGNAMGNNGELMADALKVNGSLTSLDISNCGFGFDEDCIRLSEALAQNNSLTELKLDNNRISTSNVLFGSLKVNSSLKTLSIKSILLSTEGVNSLCDALTVNRTLTELDLGSNRIGVQSLKELMTKPLKSIRLHKCISKFEEIDILCTAVMKNHSTTNLSLAKCSLNVDCCRVLGSLLKATCTLRSLNLSMCLIDLAGYEHICEGLKYSESITKLEIGRHPLDIEACKALGRMLAYNQSIRELTLTSYIDAKKTEELYNSGLKFNEALVCLASANISAIKFSGVAQKLEQNKHSQREVIRNSLGNITVIARHTELRDMLPTELWLHIFNLITSPGVNVNFLAAATNIFSKGN